MKTNLKIATSTLRRTALLRSLFAVSWCFFIGYFFLLPHKHSHAFAQAVTTFAGNAAAGLVNNTGALAQFNQPNGIAIDGSGNFYIADKLNHCIRRITPLGVVTTFAGTGVAGWTDGAAASAQFTQPTGVAVDGSGNVYVADFGNHRIRKIVAGVVSTLAGSGVGGYNDAMGTLAQFQFPTGVAVDGLGNVYVADYINNRIRRITALGAVTTLAGSGVAGSTDAAGVLAQFNLPVAVAVNGAGTIVYVADQSNNRIRAVTTALGATTTLAGNTSGYSDGTGTAALFNSPSGVSVNGAGNILVAEGGGNRIRVITPGGIVTTLAGSGGAGFMDAIGTMAQFNSPSGVVMDGSGNAYVADLNNHRIRAIAPAPVPTITGFTPMTGGAGTLVTINGTNLTGAAAVTFGGIPATSFTVVSPTQITATIGAGGMTGNIAVTTPGGTALSAGMFTFIQPPTIASFTPTSQGGGMVVTITGTNFTGATAVSFGGIPAAIYTIVSSTQIDATVAAGGATGNVVVTTPGGTATLGGFTFILAPTITSFAPMSAAAGASVVIMGANLSGATLVSFGGVAATITANTATSITATVAAGGATGNVLVTNPGGTVTQTGFTFLAPPTVTSFSPMSAGPGMSITIMGTNFVAPASVTFGGIAATSVVVVTPTQITCNVGVGGASGVVQVTTPNGVGSSAPMMFTFVPAPIITSFTPMTGPVGTMITINGLNLGAATAVTVGGTPATINTNTATDITATVGAGTTGFVVVSTAGGTASSTPTNFTFAAPAITSFAPTMAAAGAVVTITGNNFTGATQVQIGGVNCPTYTVVSNTQIDVTVPAGAMTGLVRVTTPGGFVNSVATFTFLAPPPTITGFTPPAGGNSTVVTITGTNFQNVTGVLIGGTAAASYTVISPTQINATVGAGATGVVTINTLSGTANSVANFTWHPQPTVTMFTPTSGIAGTVVTITGTNFMPATQVRFGGTNAASFTVDSPTQITATLALGSSGAVDVISPGGVGTLGGFIFMAPVPTITSFTPTSGGNGTVVVITGTNFFGASAVRFGGTNALHYTVNSATQITATVAGGASGLVEVVTPGGTASQGGFTWQPVPTITSYSPNPAGATTVVTINGNNFIGTTTITFGVTNAPTFTVVSPTVLTVVVPAGATSPLQVRTPGGMATAGTAFTFAPAPTITSFTPMTAGAGTTITINGSNFTPATSVSFGGVPAASFNFVNAGQVTVTVGAGASGNVTVSNVGGTVNSAGFTFVAAPTITSFTPMAGIAGTVVTINGSNLTGVTQVRFGGVAAMSFTPISATQLTAVVGAGASGNVEVVTAGGTGILGGFVHSASAPSILGFVPTSAGNGTTVVITGNNFLGATQVQFGGVNAASFVVNSNTQITAVVGAGASGSVTVTTPGGTASQTGFTFVPPPTITSFAPMSGGLGNIITITGTGFLPTTQATIGGVSVPFTVVSPTQITATVGTGATGNITVSGPGGTATLGGFTYLYFTPTITSFTPTSQGGGNAVTINGTNFVGVTGVSFGGMPAMSFSTISPTQVIAFVGALGASGNVQLTTPGGMATLGGFTYIPAPVISSFIPTSRGMGQTVTIFGNNFMGVTGVSFGGVPAAGFTVMSSTVITATVGAGATGNVEVTSGFGTGLLAGFTYLLPPNPTSIAPTSAAAGTTVVITGTNFTGATGVSFGGTPAASFIIVSPTQINAVVAPGGATGNVTVTGPGGPGNLAGFTFIAPPTITGFAPTSAGTGAAVLITGNFFTGATAVSFGGVPATFTVLTINLISATVPAGGATGSIQVTTPGGTVNSPGFTYLAGPTITGISPTSAGPTMTVVITGSGFTGVWAVNFGGVPATSFTVVSATQINAVVAGGASGNVSVTGPGGTSNFAGFTWVPTPVITSFAPPNAAPGAMVILTGMNFSGATQVRFGGTPAASFTVVSPTQINATVAAGSTTGAVSVTTAGGIGNLAGFIYLAPPPTITSFTPGTAGVNMTVTINGTFLSGATAVSFGGTPALSYSVMSDNQIVATVGAGTSGMVQVTTPGGTVNSAGFIFAGTPTITSFTPMTAASGATITINGTNFPTVNAVSFGGFPAASYTLISPTQITAVLSPNTTSGSVMVTTSGGTATMTGFTFLPAPTISSFAPVSAGPGMNVLITGTNFAGVGGVFFGGVPAAGFVIVSPTQILATVPASGATGVIQVNTTGGVASRIGFTFIPAPIVSAFTPTSAGTGTPVTVTGANFTNVVAVRFGGTLATSFTVNNSSQLTAVVAAGASGAVSVQTLGGTSATAGFTFVNNPTITSIMPTSGEPGATITLTGTNFTGATAVSFGGRPAAMFTVVSATQITAVVPVNAGDPVTVSTPGGTGSLSGFVYLPAPRITSFSPMSTGVGQSITILGANFAGVTAVSIGGIPAERFTIVSPSQIVAVVSAEGASGSVSVTSPDGTASLAGFVFQFPMPTIADFTPKTAGPGVAITISGTGFLSVSTASFGGVDAQRFTVVSSREITAIVANGASGAVSVRTPGGTATLQGFTFVPVPVITSIAPQSAIVGTTVTITGQNFANITAVSFGGVPAMFMIVSPTEIRVVVSGNGAVSLTNPGGTTVSSAFTTLPPPTISGFSPTVSGSNATITISGFNFTGASRVSFGGVTAASFRVVSPNQIQAIVAAGSTGSVSITTTAGTASVAGYTFVPAPTITDVSPRESGEGLRVVISGTNLSTVQTVWFGGVTAASVSALSQTRIEAVVGTGATGRVTVATLGGVASTTGIVFVPKPIITNISPQTGEVGTTVRIVGRNFTAARAVLFGGLAAGSFTIVSDSVLTAVVGMNSSNGTISVVSAGGTGVSTQAFTFVAPPPTIQNFSPTTAGSGQRVFVSGTNFLGVKDVRFGGVSAIRFNVISPTELEAFVATGSTGSVQIITQTGMVELGGFAFAPPAQVVTFTPTRAGAGQTVVIEGENFINVSAVSFGGVSAASFSVLANRITATLATGATGEVRVTALGGSGSRPGFTFVLTPKILSFTPTSIGGRGIVTITGANFIDASEVRFGGVLAIRHEVVSSSRITAIVAEGARNGAVSVRTPGGIDSLQGFVFVNPPTIDGFTPLSAAPTNIITIAGTNFTTTAQVSFGGVLSSNVVVVSPTIIRASVPQGTTGGTITVLTVGGSVGRNGFSLLSPPRISSFSPTRASSGTVITINGANFEGLSEVRFGGVTASSIRFISPTQVTAVVATGASGIVSVMASSGTANLEGFSFIAPPAISGFTPRGAGAGLAVTIIGTNFTQASAVSFGGRPAARFTLVSPTQITAIVSSGATGEVAVTAEGGTGTRAGFTFIPKPDIIALTPSVGAVGTVVVITGRAFTGASSVVIGNVSVPFSVNSDTQITVTIPLSGAASGTITITSAGGVGISQQIFRYVPPPSIAEAVFVQSRQGLILRISGANFTSTQNVNIGRANVSFTVVNPTQLTASIPAGVSPNDVVTVVTQGGIARTEGMPVLPTITNVSPVRGRPGTRITITGRNLAGTTQASIGGVSLAITPQMVSATQVTLTVPPEGVSGVIGLTTPFGVVSTTTSFTLITAAPLITSFSPTRGDVGTVIQVFGENFGTVTSVFIGGVAIPFRLISVNEMILTMPRTGTLPSGSIVISSPTGISSSQDRFVFTPGGVDTTPPLTPQGEVRTYPNPASESLTIAYNLATPQIVTLRIMDMRGDVLRVIAASAKDTGEQTEILDVRDYPPGIYLVSLETPIQRVSTLFTVMR